MDKRFNPVNSQSSLALIAGVVSGAAVVGGLYWAQSVLIPVALAILLAFLLSPAVKALQRWHLDRRLAVGVVMLIATTVIVAAGWLVKYELTHLAAGLPAYTENIQTKTQHLKSIGDRAGSGHLGAILKNLTGTRDQSSAQNTDEQSGEDSTEVEPAPAATADGNWQARVLVLLGMVMSSAASLAFALVLVIFMLLEREPLRNRLIRLMGQGRITVTTKALDDTGARISRYLHMQFALNSSYGVVWGGALYFIGVDYALLWGFLAGVMRYVPYLGAWLGALFPIALSLAQFPGWWPTLIVIGVVLLLELIWNNALEPWFYGQSIGVSPVGMLIAVAFWTLLWGPVGLVLSGPLTICIVVVGKYVPDLSFFTTLLGDTPTLEPSVDFYQRLLARDQDDASQYVAELVDSAPPVFIHDQVLIPALSFARRDRDQDLITGEHTQYMYATMGEILDDLGLQHPEVVATVEDGVVDENTISTSQRVKILACPARDQADQLALEMLRQLLPSTEWELEITAMDTLTAELVQIAATEQTALIIVSALPPGGLAHARYLCKRLRAQRRDLKIVVGRWGQHVNVESNRSALLDAGADRVVTSLLDARDLLNEWQSDLLFRPPHQEAAASGK